MSFLSDLYKKVSGFIKQNPTPAGYINRQFIQPTVRPQVQRYVQRNVAPVVRQVQQAPRRIVNPIVAMSNRIQQPTQRFVQQAPQRIKNFALNSPKLDFVDRAAKNQTITGIGKTTADLMNMSQRIGMKVNPLAKTGIYGKTNRINANTIDNLRSHAEKNQPKTTWEKAQRMAGETLPYMAVPIGGNANLGSQAFKQLSVNPAFVKSAPQLLKLAKLAKWGEFGANLAKNALIGAGFGGGTAIGEGKGAKEVAKSAASSAAAFAGIGVAGEGISAALSKRTDIKALRKAIAMIKNPQVRSKAMSAFDKQLLQTQMGFVRIPGKQPTTPKVISGGKPQIKISSSDNIYIKHGDNVITGIPKTVQEDLYSSSNGEAILPDRIMKANKYLNKQGLELTQNGLRPIQQSAETITPKVVKPTEVPKTGIVQDIKIKTTPKANISLESKPLQENASNLENGLPTARVGKTNKEIQLTQSPTNKVLSLNKSVAEPNSFYNVDRLNVSQKAKTAIKKEIASSGEKISAVVGKKLTNEEVIKKAEDTSKMLNYAVNKEQTAKKIASNLKLRQQVAARAQSGFKNKKSAEDFIDLWVKDKAAGTDIARQLQARRISADPQEQETINLIMEAIYKQNKNADAIKKAASRYDLNDPEQLTKFYREFVKPSVADWIDVLRYNSMLSSPTTHLVNISSNLQGASLIEPITKTVTGSLDAVRAALTGTKRQAFAGEGLEYAKGYYGNLRNASKKLWDIMTGKQTSKMQEIYQIPLTKKGTAGRVVENVASFPGRLLQGMDEFFTALGEAGNLRSLGYRASKGVKVKNMGQTAYNTAKETIFNAPFNLDKEGYLLKAVEYLPARIGNLKNADNPIIRTIAKFTFPFVRIGSNLLKSGIQYSPLGIGTLPGATNKTEQLSKFIIGTASALGVATLLGQDRLTWAEPINEKQRNAFRSAGMQPYAVKIGDKWISYSKMHPAIAFNFALIAALDDSIKNKRLSEDQADTVMQTFAKFGKFTADQSYLRNIGDFVSAAQGSLSGWSKYGSNYVQQLIPLRALMGYVERIVDPYQRQVDPDGKILEKQIQYIMMQIPWAANNVPIRKDTTDQPIMNQNRALNAVSPNRITTEIPEKKETLNQILLKSKSTKELNDLKTMVENGQDIGKYKIGDNLYKLSDGTLKVDVNGTFKTVDNKDDAQVELYKQEIRDGKRTGFTYNGEVYYKAKDGSIRKSTKKVAKVKTAKTAKSKSTKAKKAKVKKIKTNLAKRTTLRKPSVRVARISNAKVNAKKPNLPNAKRRRVRQIA